MHSLISIVGVVLSGKVNYQEWFRKIKHTLIFNDLWDGICENTGENSDDSPDDSSCDSEPEEPTDAKELAIWKSKDKKAYALIVASVSEEVSRHMISCKTAFQALKKLRDLYDSHSELEIIQIIMKLFNLEMKDNDPMKLASEIRALYHDIKATGVEVDLQLIAFIKSLYPTYSHYLESLQASEKMKNLTFDKLVEKIVEREKSFGKKESLPNAETLCLAQEGKKSSNDPARHNTSSRGHGRKQFRGRGVKIIKVTDNLFSNNTKTKISNLYNAIDVEKWVIQLVFAELLGRRFMIRKRKIKINISNHQRKVILLNLHIMLSHIVILALKKFLVLLFLLGMTLGY
jgi:hypothetical protein